MIKDENKQDHSNKLPSVGKKAMHTPTTAKVAIRNNSKMDYRHRQSNSKRALLNKKFGNHKNSVSTASLQANVNKKGGFNTQRDNSNVPYLGLKNSISEKRLTGLGSRINRQRVNNKSKKLDDYHHPMSKWMHVVYSSPAPRSSPMYQQLLTNFQKVAFKESQEASKKVLNNAPFRVAWEEHAHLLNDGPSRELDSLQEKSN